MQLEIYRHLPEYINPIIFQIGFFSVKWYSVMYLVGFAVVYFILRWRVKNGEFKTTQHATHNTQHVFDLMIYLIAGLLIGARLGYIIFYDLNYFIHNPLEIFLPIRVIGFGLQVTGISGMSYYGGLIGIIIAGLIFCKKYKISFWQLADFVVPAIPAGYFFGRIGNFLNGELYGRATDMPWGMYFPADNSGLLRHPSQLYEAFFEGIILFLILWILRGKSSGLFKPFKKFKKPVDSSCDRNPSQLESNGSLFLIYLFGYGLSRFFIEFFREPDPQIGLFFGWLTLGQIFSAMAIIVAILIILAREKQSISQYSKNSL